MAQVDSSTRKKNRSEDEIDPSDPFKTLRNRRVAAAEWWEVVAKIPADGWGRYKVYVYSLWPVIVRQLSNPDNKNHLAVIEEPFNPDWLLRKWGSGSYQLILNDLSRPESFRTVCKTELKLKDDEFPPVRNVEELDMGHPDNRSYVEGLRARGLLRAPGSGKPAEGGGDSAALIGLLRDLLKQQQAQQPARTVESQAISNAIDLLSQTYTKGVDTLTTQLKGDSPEKTVALIQAIKELVKDQPKNDSALAVVKEVMGAMKEMTQISRPAEAGSSVGNLKELIGLLREARELVPGNPDLGPGGETKWGFYRTLAEQGGQLIGLVSQGILAWRSGQQAAGPAGPGHPGAAVLPALPAPGPAPGEARPGVAPPAAPAAGPPPALSPEQIQILNLVGPALVQHVMSDREMPGLDFAYWIESGYGALLAGTLAKLGPQKLLEVLRSYPPLWGQLAPFEAKAQAVVTEFCSWPEQRERYLAGELLGEAPPPEAPPAAPPVGAAA